MPYDAPVTNATLFFSMKDSLFIQNTCNPMPQIAFHSARPMRQRLDLGHPAGKGTGPQPWALGTGYHQGLQGFRPHQPVV
jgi:hypothetical protein